MILLALLLGFVLGGLTATAACALWAFRAMHPHDDFPKAEPIGVWNPSSDMMRWKTAEEVASDLERYAARRAEGVE